MARVSYLAFLKTGRQLLHDLYCPRVLLHTLAGMCVDFAIRRDSHDDNLQGCTRDSELLPAFC